MTKQQKQRLAVAKDVIAQTKLAKYTVVKGTYVEHETVSESNIGEELQTLLKKNLTTAQPCEVCAMGACFISSVRLYDDFKLTDSRLEYGQLGAKVLKAKVAKIFTRREMAVIESCFELKGSWLKTKADKVVFGYAYENGFSDSTFLSVLKEMDDNDRLIFLMEVVIANPKQQVTVQVVKDTLLRFWLDGRYAASRNALGL